MKTLIVSALVLALAAASAHAQIFDIQVNPGGGNPQYTGTGADTMSGSNLFNQVTGSTSGQTVTSTDGLSTAAFTLAVPSNQYNSGFYYGGSTPTALYGGYAFVSSQFFGAPYNLATNATIDFTISGLSADVGKQFALYLYAQGSNHGTFSAPQTGPSPTANAALFKLTNDGGGSGIATANDGGSGAFVPGVEYVVFYGTVGANGTITGTDGFASGSGEADFSGLQLDFKNLPEPTTWAMLVVGLGGLAFVARRQIKGV